MAGMVTIISDKVFVNPEYNEGNRELIVGCVGDAINGAIPDTDMVQLLQSYYSHLERSGKSLSGWGLWKITVIPGIVGPTDNADLHLLDTEGIDILDGNGEDCIKNTLKSQIYPPVSPCYIGDKLTINVDNQVVALAEYEIKFHLIR